MDIRLRDNLPAGVSHEQRLAVARELASRVVAQHGEAVAAITIYGTTSIGVDGPYSDLDMTIVTYPDIGHETKCYTHAGLTINLDYQTVEESMEEARDPNEGGPWMTVQVLYDPHGVIEQFRQTWRSLSRNDCRQQFVRYMRDHLVTNIGKIRNAAIAGDRAMFINAACGMAHDTCRALCMLNDKTYVTGSGARLFRETMKLKILPENFIQLIEIVSGAWPASDQEIYDAAEDLWAGMQRLAEQQGLQWMSTDLQI
jgi:kanamycin nucleotidyltransferase